MRAPVFSACFTLAVILVSGVHARPVQSSTSQDKSAQNTAAAQTDDPTAKLAILVGKWQTQGAFTGGDKVSTTLECRWSPQGSFLVCDQLIKMGPAEHRQFTVYSYSSKDGYSYASFPIPAPSQPAAA